MKRCSKNNIEQVSAPSQYYLKTVIVIKKDTSSVDLTHPHHSDLQLLGSPSCSMIWRAFPFVQVCPFVGEVSNLAARKASFYIAE